jgi:nucleotide-binding universal stress UspA family protein
MRVVIGIDGNEQARIAFRLLASLRLPARAVDLVHVIERVVGPGWERLPDEKLDAIDRFLKQQEIEARALLDASVAELDALEIAAAPVMLAGLSAARQLVQHAERTAADIIVIAAREKGALEALVAGSVSRKLVVEARQSVLVAKREPRPGRKPVAVFATDHSDYANRCVERLLTLAPRGLGRIVVLTAWEKSFAQAQATASFPADVGAWLKSDLERKNQELLERLRPLGAALEARVVEASADDAISACMREVDADLLILGAQGHGFVERVTIGSTSFQQVVATPYSVLVLRV